MRLLIAILIVQIGILLNTGPAVAQSCTIAATGASFGTYTPTSTVPADTTASIGVTCKATVQVLISYGLALSPGSSGNNTSRKLTSAGGALAYQLYADAARSQIWGDGVGGTGTISQSYLLAALAPVTTTSTGYGRIPARQNPMPGAYQDMLIVTVSW